MRMIKTFWKLPLCVKWMLLECLWLSGWYRWHILKRPFSELSDRIGTLQAQTPEISVESPVLSQIRWAVGAVCSRTPWESKCLVRALTAKKLLNQRGFACTLYMGVARDKEGKMIAHAWLRCGTQYITGGDGAGYAITTRYGDIANKET